MPVSNANNPSSFDFFADNHVTTVKRSKGNGDIGSYKNRKILIVDDEEGIRRSLRLYLENLGFAVQEAQNGEEALEILERDHFFLCLTDIAMPGMGGLELLGHINGMGREIGVVMITGHHDINYAIEAIKQGACDYFKKPFLYEDLRATVLRVMEKQKLLRKSMELERLKERQLIEQKNLAEFMVALANIIDAKSPFTRQHGDRVSHYSTVIAKLIDLDEPKIRRIELGAKIHDIGKIGTPEYILHKPGPLTDEEFEIIKQHPAKGAELITPMSSFQDYIDIIHFHHEDLDGSGYPMGLAGADIPLEARIVRIADYWDAITSHRPYRQPMAMGKAKSILRAECGRKLEKELVSIFLDWVDTSKNLGDES